MVVAVGDLMQPSLPKLEEAIVAPPAPEGIAKADPNADDKALDERRKRWKLALAGMDSAPNGRQRVMALLKGSKRAGAHRIGSYHTEMQAAEDKNKAAMREVEKHEADLDTSAAAQERDTQIARSQRAEADAREYLNQNLPNKTGLENQQAAADINKTNAEIRSEDALVTYREAQTDLEKTRLKLEEKKLANPASMFDSDLQYVSYVLQAYGKLDQIDAVVQARQILSSNSLPDLTAALVKTYTDNNIFIKDENGNMLSPTAITQLAADEARKILSLNPSMQANLLYPDVVKEISGTLLQEFMSADATRQAQIAQDVRARIAAKRK